LGVTSGLIGVGLAGAGFRTAGFAGTGLAGAGFRTAGFAGTGLAGAGFRTAGLTGAGLRRAGFAGWANDDEKNKVRSKKRETIVGALKGAVTLSPIVYVLRSVRSGLCPIVTPQGAISLERERRALECPRWA